MNKAIYRQGDSRWGRLPYPTSAYSFAGNGCGCCACTHVIIESSKYAKYTPKNVRPYMVNAGFATKGHGTTWAGIKATLEHYGFATSWPNINGSMKSAWEILNKKGCPKKGVLLLRSGRHGGVVWTTSGHYVAFVDYKIKNGKHYFYTKDSGGYHNDGWFCYETTMAGSLANIWIVTKMPAEAKKTTTKKTTKKTTTKKTTAKKTATKKKTTKKKTTKKGVVTADALNVRLQPKVVKGNNIGAYPIINKGKEVTIVSTVGSGSNKWYLVSITGKKGTKRGYVSAAYIKLK